MSTGSANGNYSALHVGKATSLVRTTRQTLESRLPASQFVRIHRSMIVNLDRVAEMQPWSHGDLNVLLTDGTELRLSRRDQDRLVRGFGDALGVPSPVVAPTQPA